MAAGFNRRSGPEVYHHITNLFFFLICLCLAVSFRDVNTLTRPTATTKGGVKTEFFQTLKNLTYCDVDTFTIRLLLRFVMMSYSR